MSKKVPNPGSEEAQAQGCKCPVMDNWRGSDEIGRIRGFVMFANCPLHGFDEHRAGHTDQERGPTDAN